MPKKKETNNPVLILILVLFMGLSVLLVWDQLNITGLVPGATQSTTLNVTVSGRAPNITLVVPNPATITITEGGITAVSFTFNASDPDGDLDLNGAQGNFTYIGEDSRNSTSCTLIQGSGVDTDLAEFNCTISIFYWDLAADWVVYAFANDTGNNVGFNSSVNVTIQSTTSIEILTDNVSAWGTVNPSDVNIQPTDDPVVVNNTGNYNVTGGNESSGATENTSILRMLAVNLTGETTATEIIPAANFSISPGDVCEAGTNVNWMENQVQINLTGTALPRGNEGKAGGGTNTQNIYFCLEEVPFGLSQQSFSTVSLGSWVLSIADAG